MHGSSFFVRRGQTEWNVEDKICGSTDSPLTELGRQQAKEAGEKILSGKIKVDEIFYSPLSRARDTALIISEITGITACEDSCLFRQNFGKWDGTSPRKSAAFTADKEKFAYSHDGGESMLHTESRIAKYKNMDESNISFLPKTVEIF